MFLYYICYIYTNSRMVIPSSLYAVVVVVVVIVVVVVVAVVTCCVGFLPAEAVLMPILLT